jgi:hypothetical protein
MPAPPLTDNSRLRKPSKKCSDGCQTVIVYLGDNLYKVGLPDDDTLQI